MMKKISTLIAVMAITLIAKAEIPTGYYNSAENKSGSALKTALCGIIDGHTDMGYSELYTIYQKSDLNSSGNIWDMYSTCTFSSGSSDRCGNYSSICDCYNREHLIPQSWFDEDYPMRSDAFHVVPTDGKVNGYRGSYPHGETSTGTSVGSKGLGKYGTSSVSGLSMTVFEPDDEYKGDIARSYFYFVTRYEDEMDWITSSVFQTSYPHLITAFANLMMKWHREDPVSEKELDRQEGVYYYQKNRNPFIDYPDLAEYIWGTEAGSSWSSTNTDTGGGDTGGDDTTEPEDFDVLDATNISSTGFTANWNADTDATDYTLDVYQLTTEGEQGETEIFSADFTNGSMPDGVSMVNGGYSSFSNGGLRMGSGSKDCELELNALDLSSEGCKIELYAEQYNDDDAIIEIEIDGTLQETISLSDSKTWYSANISGTSSSVITLTVYSDRRAYLYNLTVTSSDYVETKTSVDGYPLNTGNVTSYNVNNLSDDVSKDFYYTVTSIGGSGTTVGPKLVTLSNVTSTTTTEIFDDIIYYGGVEGYTLKNIPYDSTVKLYSIEGKLIYSTQDIESEIKVILPSNGVYLLQIINKAESTVIKLMR